MKRPFSPLVWVCAVCAIAFTALPLIDPNGVYANYTAALSPNVPVIAAVFTAAQDGVYPWSVPNATADTPYSPACLPLNSTVTDAAMRSSVCNNEPFSENLSAANDSADTKTTPSVEIVAPPMTDKPDEAQDANANDGFITVDESWFDDAVFIGDSLTEGFCDYAGLNNATYYYKVGLDIWSVLKKPIVSGKLTIPQALSQSHFGKVYIMLGINEIGCGSVESYAAQYAAVIEQLRALQPDALIYIQAIFHTTQKKSDSSIYNNDAINARNAAISCLADGEHIFFIDCNPIFDDENGALLAAYTCDGVHVKAPYYAMWRDYLMRFGRSAIKIEEEKHEPPFSNESADTASTLRSEPQSK